MAQTSKQRQIVGNVVANAISDEGNGVVSFPNGLTIIDDTTLWSGASYDIDSLDISQYPGQLTADHKDSLATLIGKVGGVKRQGNKITIDKIQYAINISPMAKLAYDLMVNGFSPAFSVETLGPWVDEETRQYKNHKLAGLSQVVVGNCKSAKAYDLVTNSLATAEAEGYDVSELRQIINEAKDEPVEEVEKTEEVAVEAEQVEVAKEEVEATEATEEVIENTVEAESETEEVEEEVKTPVEEEQSETTEAVTEPTEEEKTETVENEVTETTEEVAEEEAEQAEDAAETEVVAETETEEVKEEATEDEPAEEEAQETQTNNNLEEKMTTLSKESLDQIAAIVNEMISKKNEAEVEEPKFQEEKVENEVVTDWKAEYERHVNIAAQAARTHSIQALTELEKLNEKNFNALKAEGLVSNAITIASFGSFVLPPQMLRKILGDRTDYSPILDATEWRETDRMDFAYLTRTGDIAMRPVAMCEDQDNLTENKNVKQVSTYGAKQTVGQLEEFAATTPICSAATRFLAVDLMNDAINGYVNSYDKIRAESVIYRLMDAVKTAQNQVEFTATTDDDSIKSLLTVMAEIADTTADGVFMLTMKSLLKIKGWAMGAGVNGPLGEIFVTGKVPTIFGVPYIVVPSDLMPSIGDNKTGNKTVTRNGKGLKISATVFYGSLKPFIGYTSGGLNLTVADGAAYEVTPGKVQSGFSRDELVLRGYSIVGSAYREPSKMAAIVNEVIS